MKLKLFELLLALATLSTATVYLIRHGEKNLNDSSNHNLSLRGELRSEALSRLFFPVYSKPLIEIGKIISMQQSKTYPARRATQTAIEIAVAGNLTVEEFSQDEETVMINATRNYSRAGTNVLIVWNHSFMTSIALKLLELSDSEKKHSDGLVWEDTDYDRIWQVDLTRGVVTEICQRLLFGDSDCFSRVILKVSDHIESLTQKSEYPLA